VIINVLTVVYCLISVLTVALSIPAAVVGSIVGRRWRPEAALEERHELEKWVYLVITLVAVGLSLRLVLVPLWFLALGSLIGHVPGAMCLAGIHLLDAPWSFVASALKVFVPLVYAYWLVLNALDRRIETQPLMRRKLVLQAPIALLVLIESILDFRVLGAVEPRSVSCCTSLFDMPTTTVGRALSSSTSVWVWMFLGLGVATVLSAIRLRRSPDLLARIAIVVAGAASLVSFILALHTRLSPILLHAPFHHCIFCVLALSIDVQLATALVLCGAWLAIVAGLVPRIDHQEYARMVGRLVRWSIVLLAGGVMMIAIRTAASLLA
jgi:hypothetical protein